MAVLTRDEIIEKFNLYANGDNSDTYISLLEDISDTFTDLESKRIGLSEDEVNRRINEIETSWRERYISRFSGVDTTIEISSEETLVEDEEKTSYDELFN